jgi:hypothetical protein
VLNSQGIPHKDLKLHPSTLGKNAEAHGLDSYCVFVNGNVVISLIRSKNIPKQITSLPKYRSVSEDEKVFDVSYVLLSEKRVVMVDDYGHWVGREKLSTIFSETPETKPYNL